MTCISLLGSVVWGHHMYTVGMETDTRAYFTGVTVLISLPTGTKIFNWLSTYMGNAPLLNLRITSALFAIFSGIIFYSEKMSGTKSLLPAQTSLLSLYHLLLTLVGILLTFTPMHFLGFNLMPRRIPDFPDYYHSWNFLSSIGSGITLLAFLF